MEKFKSRDEFAKEIGVSYSTLRRKIKEKNVVLPKGLLSPDAQLKIKTAFGFSSVQSFQQEKSD